MQKYACRPDIGQDQRFVQGRGNVLGVSTPNLNQWVGQILKSGEVDPKKTEMDNQLGCIVKLYDKNVNAFKLNEQITFIGILEFKQEDDNQPINEEKPVLGKEGFDEFEDFNGIPNEKSLPHLHAITSRKMAVL